MIEYKKSFGKYIINEPLPPNFTGVKITDDFFVPAKTVKKDKGQLKISGLYKHFSDNVKFKPEIIVNGKKIWTMPEWYYEEDFPIYPLSVLAWAGLASRIINQKTTKYLTIADFLKYKGGKKLDYHVQLLTFYTGIAVNDGVPVIILSYGNYDTVRGTVQYQIFRNAFPIKFGDAQKDLNYLKSENVLIFGQRNKETDDIRIYGYVLNSFVWLIDSKGKSLITKTMFHKAIENFLKKIKEV
jgi:hypothetical protein